MAGQKGRNMLLKLGNGASPATFTTILGLKSKSLSIAGEAVDITSADDAENASTQLKRALLSSAGMCSITISASGIFKNDAALKLLEDYTQDGFIAEYQMVFGNGNIYQGLFQITTLEYSGDHNAAQEYSITLESSGKITALR